MAVTVLAEVGNSWQTSSGGNGQYAMFAMFDPAVDDEADVQSAVVAAMPLTYVGFVLGNIKFDEVSHGLIRAVGNYIRGEKQNTAGTDTSANPSEFSFQIESQQVKIFSSFEEVASGSLAGETSPDNGTLLNVQPDGTIEGIEVPQMTYNFEETHNFASVPDAYKVVLAQLVGTVNDAPFRIGAAGEVMLTGVSGSKSGDDFWKLRYRFQVIPNWVNQDVGPFSGVDSIDKNGWDYIEFFTRDKENTTSKRVEKKITGYKIHRVLRYSDYSLLGLGS